MNKKIIIPALLGALTGTMVATPIVSQVSAAAQQKAENYTDILGDDISISNFAQEGRVGEPYTVPTATEGSVVQIFNPYNVKVYDSSVGGAGTTFTPNVKGYYTVKISKAGDSGQISTTSNSVKFYVNGPEYTISLQENSKYTVPSVLPLNQKLYIPVPNILDENGDALENANDEAKNRSVQVSVKGEKDAQDAQATELELINGEYYLFEGVSVASKVGTYDIVYKFIENGVVYDTLTTKFVVKKDYDLSKIELNFSWSSTKPTSATLGEELSLPKIKIFDSAEGAGNKTIEGYADIQVLYYDGKSSTPTDVSNQVKDYKFTPTLPGDYVFKYTAKAFYNGESYVCESSTASFRINDVKDNKAPHPYVVKNYTYDAETDTYSNIDGVSAEELERINSLPLSEKNEELLKVLGDESSQIPSIVQLNGSSETTVTLPAIFAADNYNKLSNLKLKVEYKEGTGAYKTADNVVPGQNISIKLTKAGNYTIRYVAVDESENESIYSNETLVSFDLKVVDTLTEEEKTNTPDIVFDSLKRSIKNNETLTFNPPTATDEIDTRVNVKTYYGFTSSESEPTSYTELTYTNDEGKYEVDLSKITEAKTAKEMWVKVVAKNDYNDTETVIRRKITIVNTADADVPTIQTSTANMLTMFGKANGNQTFANTGLVDGKAYFNQTDKTEVNLPTFMVWDESDPNLQISVKVTNPYGENVTLQNSINYDIVNSSEEIGDATINGDFQSGKINYKVYGGSFNVNYYGTYTVTYTIKDAGNNMVIRTFGVVVGDTKAPDGIYPVSTSVFNETQELGSFVTVPEAYIIDDGQRIDTDTTDTQAKTWWTVSGPSATQITADGFVPTISGEYKITYFGTDAAGNEIKSAEKIITVDDTIKPEITLEKGFSFPETVAFNKDDVESNVITIPSAVVTDKYTDETMEDYTTLEVKITDKDGDAVSFKKVDVNGSEILGDTVIEGGVIRYQFTATENGNYTVTYVAKDKKGNTTELTKTVAVGDTTAPELSWTNEKTDLVKKANIGDTLTININTMFNFTDNYDITDDYIRKNAKVYLLDPSNSIISESVDNSSETGIHKWEFEKSGNYTLRIIIKDENGNTATPYEYTIEVSDNTVDPTTISPVAGTILIVVSVLVLAGVVIYFVVTSRKSSSKKRK